MSKILIVEDNEMLRFVIEQRLKKIGYDVIVTDSADSAWEIYLMNNFDIIHTDGNLLRGEKGIDLLKKIKSIAPNQKCIMFSADEEYREPALNMGIAFFNKDEYLGWKSFMAELKKEIA